MFNFFDLPEDIALTLLSQWLPLRGICVVDAAVCNRTLRHMLLNYLSNDAFVLAMKYHGHIICNCELLYWLSDRCVGVEALTVKMEAEPELSRFPFDLLRKKGHVITQFKNCNLRVNFAKSCCLYLIWLIEIVVNCVNLEVFSGLVMMKSFVGGIQLLRRNCTKLHTIEADSTVYLEAVKALCEGGNTVLENLTLCNSTDSNKALVIAAKNCPNLHSLILAQNDYGSSHIEVETIIVVAQHCHHLKKLWLGKWPKITDAALVALGKGCPHLTEFNHILCSPDVTIVGFRALAQGCSKLTSVTLENPSDEVVVTVAKNCKKLTRISLYRSQALTDVTFQAIGSNCSNLTSFGLSGSSPMTWVRLSALARGCKKLTEMFISSSLSITDEGEGASAMTELLANLTNLIISNASMQSDSALLSIARCCPNLREISLSICSAITAVGLTALACRCPKLVGVDLIHCPNITDEGVIALAEHCRELTNFYISDCTTLTDAALVGLSVGCLNLVEFSVYNCPLLTSAGLTALARGCPQLSTISVVECAGITEEGVQAVVRYCKELMALNLRTFAPKIRFATPAKVFQS